jgi:hypothetical protein
MKFAAVATLIILAAIGNGSRLGLPGKGSDTNQAAVAAN